MRSASARSTTVGSDVSFSIATQSASGTGLSKLFDIQNRQFMVVSCTNCGYSELYRGQSSGNMVNPFLG
ncbi:hypothetical protein JMJ58_11680 [Haloterrigena salifodinae]|uniref:Nucleic acid-binding protein n=1 Tax=Haloterrigena salifodinae TaxID=2675099 RepID=A0A8T8E6R9_9EURY|nr:hypothetical protein JMJ58_11680 [Haloterrigena salifodinae]